jgi:hypothetical protein
MQHGINGKLVTYLAAVLGLAFIVLLLMIFWM